MAGENGDIQDEMEKEAILNRANEIIDETRRPESPFRGDGFKSGFLSTYQAVSDKILQELKNTIFEEYDSSQAEKFCGAIEEAVETGDDLEPILYRLVTLSSKYRMEQLLQAFSHITIGGSDNEHKDKKHFWQRSGNQESPISQ